MIEVITCEKVVRKGVLNREAVNKKSTKTWINVVEPTKEEIKQLQSIFNLHQTTADDITSSRMRPKVEQFPDYTLFTHSI